MQIFWETNNKAIKPRQTAAAGSRTRWKGKTEHMVVISLATADNKWRRRSLRRKRRSRSGEVVVNKEKEVAEEEKRRNRGKRRV